MKEDPDKKLTLFTYGQHVMILVSDPSAMEDISKFIPSKLDRADIDIRSSKKRKNVNIGNMETSKEWKDRIYNINRALGVNHSSRFIPSMIKECEIGHSKLAKNIEIDLVSFVSKITFNINVSIILGKDTNQKVGNV